MPLDGGHSVHASGSCECSHQARVRVKDTRLSQRDPQESRVPQFAKEAGSLFASILCPSTGKSIIMVVGLDIY